MDVRIVRFLGGEEILTEIVADTGEKLHIKNPVRVILIPNKLDQQNPSIGLAPYAQFAEDEDMRINTALVVTTYKPVKEMVDQYRSMFSGLVLPQATASKLILPQ